jgi:hypothetical protein
MQIISFFVGVIIAATFVTVLASAGVDAGKFLYEKFKEWMK